MKHFQLQNTNPVIYLFICFNGPTKGFSQGTPQPFPPPVQNNACFDSNSKFPLRCPELDVCLRVRPVMDCQPVHDVHLNIQRCVPLKYEKS